MNPSRLATLSLCQTSTLHIARFHRDSGNMLDIQQRILDIPQKTLDIPVIMFIISPFTDPTPLFLFSLLPLLLFVLSLLSASP